MASVNKVKVGSTIYDVSPSPTGTLDNTAYTSGDAAQSSATSWTSVNQIVATETNASIFTKITQMIRNVRYLYNLIGTGTFSTTNTITNVVNNKANASHSHTTAQLPTSNTQINSTAYVPTSALVYSMNQTLNELNDALTDTGFIPLPYDPTDPNGRYSIDSIAILKSIEDTDKFCRLHSHDNNYAGLALGQRIYIEDGTYNKTWIIAGFDCEYNHTASDGSIKNNGYGIMLIPETYLIESIEWNDSPTYTFGGYLDSSAHKSTLSTAANNLKKVLGTHLVNRNVLLSSDRADNASTAYTWTTAYCTLPSVGQLTGTFAQHNNKYDDGEANYKLPLFDYMSYHTTYSFLTRNISTNQNVWVVYSMSSNSINDYDATSSLSNIRPLIYIR